MKRLDRLITVFSIFLVKLAVIYGILFLVGSEATTIFTLSVIGLLLLIFYLFGEVVAVEIQQSKEEKERKIVQRKIQQQKKQVYEKAMDAFRKIFGGEDYVE